MLERAPRLREGGAGDPPALVLALDHAPGGERLGNAGARLHERPDALLGDGRVLVVAEHVLEQLGVADDGRGGLADGALGELGGIAGALDGDAGGVQLGVGRILRRARAPSFAAGGTRAPRAPGATDPPVCSGGACVSASSRSISATKRGSPSAARSAARSAVVLGLERAQEHQERALVGAAEQVRIATQVLHQHVEIAHRAERAAEPAQLGPQRAHPIGVEQRPGGAQDRAHPPRRHPHLVQLLRIGAEPGARMVADDRLVLGAQRGGDVLAGRRRPAQAGAAGAGACRSSAWKSFGRESVSAAPGPAQAADDGAADRPCRPSTSSTSISSNRRAIRRPSNTDTASVTTSASLRSPSRARTPVRRVRRRATGTGRAPRRWAASRPSTSAGSRPRDALELELEPILAVGQLQLPGAVAALGAVAQGDPGRGQPQVGRVVIGRTELPHRQGVARQGRELETRGRR